MAGKGVFSGYRHKETFPMKRFLAALCLAALSGSLSFAETAYTVQLAVDTALANNVSIERNAISYDALARKYSRAWNELVPSVQAGAGVSRGNESGINSLYGNLSASLSVSPSVVKSMEKTRLDYEAGKITREAALRDVELSVRKAFYSLLYARENVSLLENTVSTAQKQYEQTFAKQRAGLVPEVDLLSAQVTLENLKPDLESARTALLNDMASFRQILGIDQGEAISLEGSLDEALSVGEIDLAGKDGATAAVEKLEKSLEIAGIQKDIVKSGSLLPSFSLSYSYKPTKTDQEGSEWQDAGSISASVSLSLDGFLPFSSSAERIRAADDTVRDIRLELNDKRISSRIERETLLRSVDQSRASLKARVLGVSLAEKNYSLTDEAYRLGAKELLSLQDSADSLQKARVSLMKESYALISTVLDLEYSVGVPFGTLGR